MAVYPGIRNPRFAPGFLRICCYAAAQSFSKAIRLLRGVRTRTATAKTKDRRMAVYSGIRNPRFALGFLRICCYAMAQSFSKAIRLLRGVRTRTATAKTKDRRMAVYSGIRNPRFALGFLRICCYAMAQSFSKAIRLLRGVRTRTATAKTKDRRMAVFCFWWSIGDSNP